jgi:dihydropteroate synthase
MSDSFVLIKFKHKGAFRALNKFMLHHGINIDRSSLFYYDSWYYIVINNHDCQIMQNQGLVPNVDEYILAYTKNHNNDIGRVDIPNLIEEQIKCWGECELKKSVGFVKIEQRTNPSLSYSNLTHINGRTLELNQHKIIRLFEDVIESYAIINYTPDSFSDGGRLLNVDVLCSYIIKQICDGANVIDLGVESTNPKSQPLTAEEEITRLKQVISEVINLKNDFKFKLSIDTYHFQTVKWLNQFDVDIINDVSGALDLSLVKDLTDNGKKYIAMHNLGVPARRENIIADNSDPLSIILDWCIGKIERFAQNNIDLSSIIIDPGIGFGKHASQSWYLIQNLALLYKNIFPCELMLGHSRKSFISHVSSKSDIDLDVATAMIARMVSNSVDYVRIHNIYELAKVFSVLQQQFFI